MPVGSIDVGHIFNFVLDYFYRSRTEGKSVPIVLSVNLIIGWTYHAF